MVQTPETLAETVARLREDYRALMQRLEANQEEFRRLGRAAFRIQEEERRRLSRELHDGLGQNLTALKHRLSLLGTRAGPDAAWIAGLEEAIELCNRSLAETRELSRLLRPQILDDLGLEAALGWLGRTLGPPAGVDIRVRVAPLPTLDGDLQTLVFRVVQEALVNIARHAGAGAAWVHVGEAAGILRLEVGDDGRGFDVEAAQARASRGESAGLGGMRDRLALYGGRLHISSGPGGTRLEAAVPLPGPDGTLAP
ncbi:hypothetical protein N790_04685 [Arenimonas malthae CC-JY-1]|uniref:Histidine kinase/HSP90-like ATPase domain-containing protein n=1 Tax=Arenimonas malthae CC-JY-1 TaxID=1384054 RepID=A0A091BIK7_9GAMM|nr:sensor histidine kinase [Arenimonas malthae]KFN51596.1 hypothetical protein N790_04685 [Arenimonas malthae CC-JY-1]